MFYECKSVIGNLAKYKCFSCNKNFSNKIDEESKNQFTNTFKFPNNDINKFIFLLRKDVYPYEYVKKWDKFSEKLMQGKDDFTEF